jgi:hypothetical protein
MGNFIMGLLQLPQIIEVVNHLSARLHKLEKQVQSLVDTKNNEVKIVHDPIVNKKPVLKKSA